MLAFGVVTLLLMVLLYALQCFILDYFLIILFSPFCYTFVVLDGFLLIYMVSNYNIDYAASSGGVQWIMYSWLYLAKLVLFYWFIFGYEKSLDSSVIGAIGIYSVLFLTPIIYCILSFRSSRQLYGPASTTPITIESMLHADMVVHVMLDLLDLITAFNYADLPEVVRKDNPLIHTGVGIVIIAGVFLHSYSFPTMAGAAAGQTHDPHMPDPEGDTFLTRKHAALVAMFLIDLPLMIIRTFLWVTYPKNPGFSPFLVKNIIFLPLQTYRLNQCRLAERERARSSQKQSFYISEGAKEGEEGGGGIQGFQPQQPQQGATPLRSPLPDVGGEGGHHDVTPIPGSPIVGTHPTRKKSAASWSIRKRKKSPLNEPTGRPSSLSLPTRSREEPVSSTADQRAARSGTPYLLEHQWNHQHGGGDMTSREVVRFQNQTDVLLPRLASHDEHPVASADPSQGQSRTQVASVAKPKGDLNDQTLVGWNGRSPEFHMEGFGGSGTLTELPRRRVENIIHDLKSVREIPVKGFGVCKLTVKIFHCLRSFGRHGLPGILDDSFVLGYWKQLRIILPLIMAWTSEIAIVAATRAMVRQQPLEISDLRSWQDIPFDYQIFIYMGSANLLLMFLLWIGTAPLLDVAFVSLMWAARFTSFFLVYTTFRDARLLELQSKWNLPHSTADILIWGFVVFPSLKLLDAVWPIRSALSGRKYMHVVVPGRNNKVQSSILTTASALKENQLDEQRRPRSDESSWMTTSSVLVFLNCRNCFAPISYGELLIGPDLIKSVRLIDMMVLRSWLELGYVIVFEFVALFNFFSFVNMGIFAGVVLMQSVYNIFIQAIRLLALRRYEIKVLFEEIVSAWSKEHIKGPTDMEATAALGGAQEAMDEAVTGATDFQEVTHRLRKKKKRRFISLLDVMEKYQRQGFFTSPGDLIPSFF